MSSNSFVNFSILASKSGLVPGAVGTGTDARVVPPTAVDVPVVPSGVVPARVVPPAAVGVPVVPSGVVPGGGIGVVLDGGGVDVVPGSGVIIPRGDIVAPDGEEV